MNKPPINYDYPREANRTLLGIPRAAIAFLIAAGIVAAVDTILLLTTGLASGWANGAWLCVNFPSLPIVIAIETFFPSPTAELGGVDSWSWVVSAVASCVIWGGLAALLVRLFASESAAAEGHIASDD